MTMTSTASSSEPRHAGFTLVELLVVVGIIALLSSIALPVSQRLLHRSKSAHCMGNLRSLGSSLQLYLGDNNNVMPTMLLGRESKEDDQPVIDNTLNAYAGSADVFRCKADEQGFFEKTGTSYHWNNLLNGQNVASMDFMGFIRDSTRIPVIGDKEGFHKFRDVKVNILYADGHVAKEISFLVSGE